MSSVSKPTGARNASSSKRGVASRIAKGAIKPKTEVKASGLVSSKHDNTQGRFITVPHSQRAARLDTLQRGFENKK